MPNSFGFTRVKVSIWSRICVFLFRSYSRLLIIW